MKEIAIGEVAAADHSSLRGQALLPILAQAPAFVEVGASAVPGMRRSTPPPAGQGARTPVSSINVFDAEFRSHFGYNQPATPLSAMGVIAAATGDTASKYVARRETPLYIPENCTQCMECISVCPDTALPNCSQDLSTLARHRGYALRRRSGRAQKDARQAARDREAHAPAHVGRNQNGHAAADDYSRSHGDRSTASRPKPRRSSSRSLTRCRWPTRR